MKPTLSSPCRCFFSEAVAVWCRRVISTPTRQQAFTRCCAFFRGRGWCHRRCGGRGADTRRLFLGRHVLPGITTWASLWDWRLCLAGRKPPLMACDELLSVSGGLSSGTPEHVCAQALIEAWCRVDSSDRRLLSARCSDGRPG